MNKNKGNDPKVAIIILTWNKKSYVINLLTTIEKITYRNYEIIVVDNASTDGTCEAIEEEFPNVQLIVNSRNLGGTGGFNTGIKYALAKGKYDYLWLLDNDVEVEKSSLGELIRILESSKKIAVAGSAMYDLTNKEQLLELGYFIELSKGRFHDNKSLVSDSLGIKELFIVDSVSSCSLCVSVNAINDVGIWDENFFIYCDDVDWNIRFGKKGYEIASVPSSIIWHVPWLYKLGFNTVYYANRNMMYLISKHLSFPENMFSLIYKELAILRSSYHLFQSKEYYYSILTLQSLIDFFDKKFGQFDDDTFIKGLELHATKNPYRQWFRFAFLLILKNVTYTVKVILLASRNKLLGFARSIFSKLSPSTRLSLTNKINDYYLSKRVKCQNQ